MLSTNEIIAQYRKGDFDTRLSLFMEYRDLRDAFVEIDQKEPGFGNRRKTGKTGFGFCRLGWGLCHQ